MSHQTSKKKKPELELHCQDSLSYVSKKEQEID
jgi:hypothetical protein